MALQPDTKGKRRHALGVSGKAAKLHGLVSLPRTLTARTVASPLHVLAQVTGLSSSLYLPLLQECSGQRKCQPQPDCSPLRAELGGPGLHPSLCSVLRPSFGPCLLPLPTFRCFIVCVSQTSLCIEQGILCSIMAVPIVETSRVSLTVPFL